MSRDGGHVWGIVDRPDGRPGEYPGKVVMCLKCGTMDNWQKPKSCDEEVARQVTEA